MFRSSLRSVRVLGKQPLAAASQRQWPISASRRAVALGQRGYADKTKPPVLPASETTTSERVPVDTKPDIPEPVVGADVPLTPPAPKTAKDLKPEPPASIDDVGESMVKDAAIPNPAPKPKDLKPEPPASIDDVGESMVKEAAIPNAAPTPTPAKNLKPEPPASIDDFGESKVKADALGANPLPPTPKKKGFFARLRRFVLTLLVLGVIGFSGGVWYSRINDNFHDFFTEYIPFGEQAVLYLEELDYKKRFPNPPKGAARSLEGSEHIRIPAQSGASWRVADGGETGPRVKSASPSSGKSAAKDATVPAKTPAKEAPKVAAETPAPTEKVKEVKEKVEAKVEKVASDAKGFKAPEVNEPSKFPPLQPIDLLSLPDAREPIVQEIVGMLNDLILVINADGAHGKYGSTILKAKDDVKKVGSQLKALKGKIEKKSADEVKSKVAEFDQAATELVTRIEKAMASQEAQWRQEFEGEMKRVRDNYDEKVKLLVEREQKLNEQKLQNQLAEQAIALKKEFTEEVKNHVEKERESRLGRLDDLTSAVKELEDLSLGWNSVVDSNLKTQQLHVAVEAVRAKLESATHPQPFIKELVALKEIAAEDSVVNSAIASINPTAYQRGIFTTSQLIDRFRKVAGEVRKASLLPEDAGVASHASSWVLSHVMFKKQGLPEGDDVESVLTRTQIFLEEGDLDGAAREMNGLNGWAKTLSKDWLLEVRKVLEVQQALDVIATEARLQSLRVE